MSPPSGIQDQILEVTVVGCYKLRDTEWISRQDPYVCLEYASTRFRTRTCTDGGKNPTFNEKFMFTLIEGLREINVHVWNSNTLSHDDFIGSGKILLQKVLSQGYDDSTWPVQTKGGRHGGEVRVIMHYATTGNSGKPTAAAAPSPYPPPYPAPATAYTPLPPYPAATYPPYGPPPPTAYAPSPYPSYSPYPPPPATYPPASYPPQPSTYPPPTYPPQTYPPQSYPPPPTYPPGQASYPPAAFPGIYPPPPSY